MENTNSPYMGAYANAPYSMGANVNAPYMGANAPHMAYAPAYKCPPPRRNNFILIVVLFILLIIVGCSVPKW
ncbi:YjcZ family sporulation protein [Halobacillus sp. H74]|uniref:YjcZ family sporulation protein n=1 Tax=Halobacillus sp. H74 TaxID=3457436 RepID=UPI003FCCF06D